MIKESIAELISLGVISGLSYATINYFSLSPLDNKLSREDNNLRVILVPVSIYISFRIYVGIVLHVTYKYLNNINGKYDDIFTLCSLRRNIFFS